MKGKFSSNMQNNIVPSPFLTMQSPSSPNYCAANCVRCRATAIILASTQKLYPIQSHTQSSNLFRRQGSWPSTLAAHRKHLSHKEEMKTVSHLLWYYKIRTASHKLTSSANMSHNIIPNLTKHLRHHITNIATQSCCRPLEGRRMEHHLGRIMEHRLRRRMDCHLGSRNLPPLTLASPGRNKGRVSQR